MKNALGLVLLTCVLMSYSSCSKDTLDGELNHNIDKLKLERYISISFQTPPEKIIYNKNTKQYTFGVNGEHNMSKDAIEKLYEISNEYKAKHEN